MEERLVQLVLSVGFLKWIWDGVRFTWRKLYRERVSANLYVAFSGLDPDGALEKKIFLVVRNDTTRDIAVDMFLWESSFWHRFIRARKMPKIVIRDPIVRVPASKAMQQAYLYIPGNIINPVSRYFAVRLTSGKAVWVPTLRWAKAVKELKRDFPDWANSRMNSIPLRYKAYA